MMVNEKRLIDANALIAEHCKDCPADIQAECKIDPMCGGMMWLVEAPTVDAYTEEQVVQIIKQADKLAAKANELEKEVVWLKSCLNCKIRNVCPRHCGKVVHGCDHWEYGNNAVEVVRCKDCKYYTHGNQSAHWNEKALACFRKARLTVKADDFCSYGERREGE